MSFFWQWRSRLLIACCFLVVAVLLPASIRLASSATLLPPSAALLPPAVGMAPAWEPLSTGEGSATPTPAATFQLAGCDPIVSGDRAGEGGTTHAMAYDGSVATFFNSTYVDWQYIKIDFQCEGTLSGIRRYMTSNGVNTAGSRVMQGEGASYSLNGVNYTRFTQSTTNGWEGYVNYGIYNHAWHSVNYGWSAWLNLNTPVTARYVLFEWDDNMDALNEIEVNFTSASMPTATPTSSPTASPTSTPTATATASPSATPTPLPANDTTPPRLFSFAPTN